MANESNNNVMLSGYIEDGFAFNHEVNGHEFYRSRIMVRRKSEVMDHIPILIDKSIIGDDLNWKDKYVQVAGVYRSYYRKDENEISHLDIHILVRNMVEVDPGESDINIVSLKGSLNRPAAGRITFTGKDIADAMLKVSNRHKSVYAPLLFWNKYARLVTLLDKGEMISITGRIQSREYVKNEEKHTVIEVSVQEMEGAYDEQHFD